MSLSLGVSSTHAQDEEVATSEAVQARPPLPIALKLVLLTLFIPEGFSIFVGGLRLTLVRILFLLLTPMLFVRLLQKVAAGRYRFVASDLFVPLAAFWMFLGPIVNEGISDALQHSGPIVLEYLIAYMATRVLITENGGALAFASFLCAVIAVVCLDGLLDTLTGHYFTRDLADHLTGYSKDWNVADAFRFGLLRAAGPLEHAILFGLTAVIGWLLALWTNIRSKRTCTIFCGLGAVICFSSAPEQAGLLGCALMIYGVLLADVRGKWLLIFGVMASGALALFLGSSRPFGLIFDVATIDAQTGYYRLYIWNSVGPAILQAPWFGVLPANVAYEGSVDSLWLVLSMSYGMPCAVLVGLSLIGSCSLPTGASQTHLTPAESRLGTVLGIIMFLIIFMGFTVHLWGIVWILVGLLAGLRAQLGELGRLNGDDASEATPAGWRDPWETGPPRPCIRTGAG